MIYNNNDKKRDVMGYDQWLEQPYQDACRLQEKWETAEEDFLESDSYLESYDEWLEIDGNADKSEADYQQSADYAKSVDNHSEWLNSRSRYD